MGPSNSDEKLVFKFGLAMLFISGCVILGINTFTDSRKAQLADSIAKSMWGFTPVSTVQAQLQRQKWAYRKLIAAGVMMCSLMLSTSVRAVSPRFALWISGGICLVWCVGVTVFWYWSVLPGVMAVDLLASKDEIARERVKAGSDDGRLPVTVITGFLGAGKTTLVKHILSNTVGMKVLVIENEIGQEGIDHDLLLNYAGKEEIILLKNGCICCTVRSDLIQTFRAIFQKNLFTALDWVVIETTGLADPAPIIQSLLVDEECKRYLRLDSVLTLVDSKHISVHLPLPGPQDKSDRRIDTKNTSEAALQIAFADRILLNKVDLVSSEELQQVKDLAQSVNPHADIIVCQNSEVDLNAILNIRTFDPSEFSKTLTAHTEKDVSSNIVKSSGFSFLPKNELGKVDLTKSGSNSLKSVENMSSQGLSVIPARLGNAHKAAEDIISTISLTLPASQPLDFDKINVWLLSLLQRDGINIYRFKGILNIHDYEEQFIMHGVHMIFNGEKGGAWKDTQFTRQSKLVFIGKNLNADEMHKNFLGCRFDTPLQNQHSDIREKLD